MDLERRKFFVSQCDDKQPLDADDARYEPFDERGLRGEPARRRLLDTIQVLNRPATQLFTGLLGSGKSTELRRLALDLGRENFFVASTNVVEREDPFIRRAEPLQPAELLLAACLTIDEALSAVHVALRSPLDALWSSLTREIAFDAALNLGVFQLKARFTGEPAFRDKLNERQRDAPLAFKRGVNGFIAAARRLVQERELGRDLVVILDGLEKIADTDDPARESAFRDVFLRNADVVRLPCHVVYPVAPFMIQFSGELGALYDAEPVVLPMVRVRRRDENVDGAGVDGMLDALRLRGLDTAFDSDETARRLVLASGGYVRDLLRLVREAIMVCPDADERLSDDVAHKAMRRIRRTYREGLFEEFREPLRRARRRKDFDLNDDSRPLLARLLRAHVLLRYHNDDEWYDAHPLLWDEIGPTED
jgi:hypothetical protein